MSKIEKFFRDPAMFFRDAAHNRRASSRTGTPTYVVGFSTWKQYLRKFFPDRNLTFLPRDISEHEFKLVWQKKISADGNAEMFIWGFKAPVYILDFIKKNKIKVVFVEDGFVRSVQLGASKAPPMSLCMDSRTPYFNAREASDLEVLLNTYDFAANGEVAKRAEKALALLLESGVSKYNYAAPVDIARIYGPKTAKRILVIGQVEDDASIEFGCERRLTNNDLVRIAVQENAGAQIIYKPHPDVLEGHRAEQSNPADVADIAQILAEKIPMAQALATIDHVYTITSLAGFEALLRGLRVTVMGAPFYSGWGLTDDRQATPRRTRQLDLKQLFAGAYLLYPKYFDPLTGAKQEFEDIVARILTEYKAAPLAGPVAAPVVRGTSVAKLPPARPDMIPTFLIGDLHYKALLGSWFDERKFGHIPASTVEKDFVARFKKALDNNHYAEFFVVQACAPYLKKYIEASGKKITYVDEGFIRSIELDEKKAPPYSLLLDRAAPHYDARHASDLENILNGYDFDADSVLAARTEQLLEQFLASGLSKYNHVPRLPDVQTLFGVKDRPRVLVLGQVEGSPAMKLANPRNYSNHDLVTIAAMENPDAQIIFKPHPAVLKLPRTTTDAARMAHLCHVLKQDMPIAQALETVDRVYTISSLGGFEALLRGIPTTTLGVPFYAGWGLGDDRQRTGRRQRTLRIDQAFAAAYLLYPVYVDPVYKMPISLETAITRLTGELAHATLAGTEHVSTEVAPVTAAPITTFVLGDISYKSLLGSWFEHRKFGHIPSKTTNAEFIAKFKKALDANKGVEFFVADDCPAYLLKYAQASRKKISYLQGGFMRSVALDARKMPPYSLLLDSRTPFYDASRPSDLEELLGEYDFDADVALRERAERVLAQWLASGLSKYNHVMPIADLASVYGVKHRPRVLVLGQVEDAPSVKLANPRNYTNNDVVMIAAMEHPDAQIIFKPHPDVLNNHRTTASDPSKVAHLCQIMQEDIPLAQALETVDQVYSISSLGGFEALLRGIKTTTLGLPFYAGWGLGDDRQAIPRRQRRMDVQQVFAAAYILYPVYVDSIYKQKVTVEQTIARLAEKAGSAATDAIADAARTPDKRNIKELVNVIKVSQDGKDDAAKPKAFLFGFGKHKWSFYAGQLDQYVVYAIDLPVNKQVLMTADRVMALLRPASGDLVVIWGKKDVPGMEAALRQNDVKIARVEDAFLRSVDLGGVNSAPLSYVFDQAGIYLDAGQESDLENILNTYDFAADKALMKRARANMEKMVSGGTSKYNYAERLDIRTVYGEKTQPRVLVIGQVEDDASIQFGCAARVTNNDLVILAKLENPDAQIIYKPHPDVLTGLRKRYSDPSLVESIALVLYEPIAIADAFETVDHVYTITSLSGFEALLRGIKVTTYGAPFYSGWGLTDERQSNARRTRTLTVEEVFAGAYILYSTYVNPFTKEKITIERALEMLEWMKKNGVQPVDSLGAQGDSKSQIAKTQALRDKGELASALKSADIAVAAYGDFASYLSRAQTKIAAGRVDKSVKSDFEFACNSSLWKNKQALLDYAKYLWEFEGYDKTLHKLVNLIGDFPDLSAHQKVLMAAMLCDGGYISKASAMLGDAENELVAHPSGYLKLAGAMAQKWKSSDKHFSATAIDLLNTMDAGVKTFEELILGDTKQFCIVGNSPTELGKGSGKNIDAFKTVIRFNEYDTDYPFSLDYGNKTTVWVRMPKNMGLIEAPVNDLSLVLISGPNWLGRLGDGVETFSGLVDRFKNVGVIPFNIYLKLVRELGSAPSAGLQILYWIYSMTGPIDSRQVYGFQLTDQKAGRNLQYRGGTTSVVRHNWEKERALFDKIVRIGS